MRERLGSGRCGLWRTSPSRPHGLRAARRGRAQATEQIKALTPRPRSSCSPAAPTTSPRPGDRRGVRGVREKDDAVENCSTPSSRPTRVRPSRRPGELAPLSPAPTHPARARSRPGASGTGHARADGHGLGQQGDRRNGSGCGSTPCGTTSKTSSTSCRPTPSWRRSPPRSGRASSTIRASSSSPSQKRTRRNASSCAVGSRSILKVRGSRWEAPIPTCRKATSTKDHHENA